MASRKHTIFIDSLSIVPDRMSGVGHNTLELIKALDSLIDEDSDKELCLVVPLWKRKSLIRHNFSSRVQIKTIPLPARVMDMLVRMRVMPPLDVLLGRGDYLFPNYRNWPLRNSKSYTYIHDAVFMSHPEFVQPKNLKYLTKYIPLFIERTDTILTLSEFSKSEIKKYFKVPDSKISIVYCGIDTSVFYKRDDSEIKKIKQKYDITSDPYVLYLGNIEPRKNLTRLIKAFDMLEEPIKQKYSLLIVGGDGWLNESVDRDIATAQQKGTKILKPTAYIVDEDLPALISGAVLLAHPALYEGFGISPLQAMACEVPVITSNSTSLPEVVADAALQVDPLDTEAIADSISMLLKDKRLEEKLGQMGRDRAYEFSWTESAKKIVNVMDEATE